MERPADADRNLEQRLKKNLIIFFNSADKAVALIRNKQKKAIKVSQNADKQTQAGRSLK